MIHDGPMRSVRMNRAGSPPGGRRENSPGEAKRTLGNAHKWAVSPLRGDAKFHSIKNGRAVEDRPTNSYIPCPRNRSSFSRGPQFEHPRHETSNTATHTVTSTAIRLP